MTTIEQKLRAFVAELESRAGLREREFGEQALTLMEREVLGSCGARIRRILDEVAREQSKLEANIDRGLFTSVPAGQTPLDKNLRHPLLNVFNEGQAARESGVSSPYHGHSLEHCLHAAGWVHKDLSLALKKAREQSEYAGPGDEAISRAQYIIDHSSAYPDPAAAALRAAFKIDGSRLIAAEREACAQIAVSNAVIGDPVKNETCFRIAAAIRSRGTRDAKATD